MSGTKDKAEGSWERTKGRAKQAVGSATGDRRLEVEGKKDRAKGDVRKAVGSAKDAAKNVKEAVEDAG